MSKKKHAVHPNDVDGLDMPAPGRTTARDRHETESFSSHTAGGIEAYRRPTLGSRITDKPKFAAGDALRDSWEPYRNYKKG